MTQTAQTESPLSASRLEEIERRKNAATEGPWAWANTHDKGYGANVGAGVFAEDDEDCTTPLSGDLSERSDDYYIDQPVAEMSHQLAAADADFIAHARTDIPDLLDEVRRLQRERDEAVKDGQLLDWCDINMTSIENYEEGTSVNEASPADDIRCAIRNAIAETITTPEGARDA